MIVAIEGVLMWVSSYRSPRRPREPATPEEVDVGVAHRLPALDSRVGHEAMTGGIDTLLAGDQGSQGEEFTGQPRVGLRHGGHVVEVLGGDDQDMDGGLGINVAEGDGPVAAGNDIRWDIARHDRAEEAVVHLVILARGPT
jgi:hypothetical protein